MPSKRDAIFSGGWCRALRSATNCMKAAGVTHCGTVLSAPAMIGGNAVAPAPAEIRNNNDRKTSFPRIDPALFRGSNRRFALILYGTLARPQSSRGTCGSRATTLLGPTRSFACCVDVASVQKRARDGPPNPNSHLV